MTKRVHCENKTKIYIPKTVNPQIISYHPLPPMTDVIQKNTENMDEDTFKRQ